jgi:hypothetical protein
MAPLSYTNHLTPPSTFDSCFCYKYFDRSKTARRFAVYFRRSSFV